MQWYGNTKYNDIEIQNIMIYKYKIQWYRNTEIQWYKNTKYNDIEIQKYNDMCPPRKSLQGPGHFPLHTKIPSEKTSFLDLHISSSGLNKIQIQETNFV